MDNHDRTYENNSGVCVCGIQLDQVKDFPYRPLSLLSTDSKMSQILLVEEQDNSTAIVKIGCIARPAQAELNQQAIVNEAHWLYQFRGQPGFAQIRLAQKENASNSSLWRFWKHQARGGRAKSEYEPEKVIQTLSVPGTPKFITVEYLSGGTLTNFVARSRLRIEMALRITHYIAQTMAIMHEKGCVHRDLKPENILFRSAPTSQSDVDRDVPTIIDFGVAAPVGAKKMVSGSRLWMAPELQAAYEHQPIRVDPATDIYALGLLLCFMITGRKPRRRRYDYASYVEYANHAIEILTGDTAEIAPSIDGGHGIEQHQRIAKERMQHTIALIGSIMHEDPNQRPRARTVAIETARLLSLFGRPLPSGATDTLSVQQSELSPGWNRLTTGPLRRIASLMLVAGLISALVFIWQSNRLVEPADALPSTPFSLPGAAIADVPDGHFDETDAGPAPTLVPLDKALARFNGSYLSAGAELNVALHLAPLSVVADTTKIDESIGEKSGEPLVRFRWSVANGERLSDAHCFQLALWHPERPDDLKMPLPPTQAQEVDVALNHLGGYPQWGVRIVDCIHPDVVVRNALEVRSIPRLYYQ